MSILKCKMCGGQLNIIDDETVVTCDYCESKQTIPTVDDDKKLKLYERANKLRFNCDFDKAATVYENIISDFPDEAEAYWGMILCTYGIEYVDDPATSKKIPTCHRSSFDSVMDDPNFEMVMENADSLALSVYREQAKQIEEIRKGIIEVSGKEKPYDIFICYKETAENGERTLDSVLAQDVYDVLTEKGYRVFFSRITLEDKLGMEYEPYIFAALNSAKVMLAFGTDYLYYNAVWVKNEWSRYLKLMAKDKNKHLIPCFKNLDAYDMPKEFAKLQAQDLGKVGAVQDLVRGIEKLIPLNKPVEVKETVIVQQGMNPTVQSLLKRVFIFLEDEKWDQADEYCEKILDIEPENGEAYLGKMLVELRISSKAELENLDEPFDDCENYNKVIRYADSKLRNELETYNENIEIRNENNRLEGIYTRASKMMESNTFTNYCKAEELFSSINEYKDSAERALECAEMKKGIKYQNAKVSFDSAKTEQEYKNAAQLFEDVRDYKDSMTFIEECYENAEIVRKNAVLTKAKSKMTGEVTANYESAIKLLKTIPSWKDADQQIYNCQKKIEEIKAKEEAERLEHQRQAEFARREAARIAKRNKKIALVMAVIVCSVTAVVILLNTVIIPNSKYNDAIGLMDEGEYEEAIVAFNSLDGYKDSIEKINECNTNIIESKYNKAFTLMNEGNVEEAYEIFIALGGYKDSADKADSIKYNKAITLLNEGNVEEAYETFVSLEGYKDSEDKANSIFVKNKTEELKVASVGDCVFFGSYEQDNDITNGDEDIEWLVLEVEDDRMLVISKYALDYKRYNEKNEKNANATWETCSLRKWLNTDFINQAFDKVEKEHILVTAVANQGDVTEDKVFLLSISEVKQYFKNDDERGCEPSAKAKQNGVYVTRNGNCGWWLRSVRTSTWENCAHYVGPGGSVSEEGYDAYNGNYGVRPAMWIDLSE